VLAQNGKMEILDKDAERTIMAEFDLEKDFRECTDPQAWAYMASVLQKAACLMDWTKKRDFTDWRYIPIYRMLMGFSMENLIKGILISEGLDAVVDGKLSTVLSQHGLKELANTVSGLAITGSEKSILYELEHYVRWAGRYPAPKTAARVVRIGHSDELHDAELALGYKLYGYLRSLNPQIDPFEIPHPDDEDG